MGRVATRVFPSPVFISAIFPSWRTIPPRICTSKWRMFRVLLATSRTTAKVSYIRSSRLSPWSNRSRNSTVFRAKSSSERWDISSSREFILPTFSQRRFISRLSPKLRTLLSRLTIFSSPDLQRAHKFRRLSRKNRLTVASLSSAPLKSLRLLATVGLGEAANSLRSLSLATLRHAASFFLALPCSLYGSAPISRCKR
ncbi:MAG: hypothetical protein DDT18_00672 [Actinobacteria bacterium]|nr:hypothetical protein [Actinomycetota bacterium]